MFSKTDEEIIDALKPVVKGIALLVGSDCEVVLHSFKDMEHSVVAIENGHITGRKIGSSVTDSGLEIIEEILSEGKSIVGPYRGIAPNGRPLRSVTVPIRNKRGRLIGALCMNFDIGKVINIKSLIDSLTVFPDEKMITEDIDKSTSLSVEELMKEIFKEVLHATGAKGDLPPHERNRLIVKELYRRRFFQIKDAVDLVAKKLGISRFTIYNYIRELKFEEKNGR
jgi:predicted transcriptional regulator YheO